MDIPLGFADGLKTQNISNHIAALRGRGYQPFDCTGSAARLKDLYCAATDTWFECKQDSHQPRNFCIELVGNLFKLAPEFEERCINGGDWRYKDVVKWLREVYAEQPTKRSIGFETDLEPRHLLSYNFAFGPHFLLPISRLQNEIIYPALREGRFTLLSSSSWDCGSLWYSVSMLVPVSSLPAGFGEI